MHISLYLTLQTALLATAALGRPSEKLSRMNHGLMKRHFWCNGVDSESICSEGQTMVPIDDFACNAIASAGRMNQISAPVNGETSTTCPQQQQQQQQQQQPQPQPQPQQQQQQPQPQSQPQPQPQPAQQPSSSPVQQQPPPSTPPTAQGSLESTPFGNNMKAAAVNPASQGSLDYTSGLKSEKVADDQSNPATNSSGTMNLSCTEVNGMSGGSSFLLNCTMAG